MVNDQSKKLETALLNTMEEKLSRKAQQKEKANQMAPWNKQENWLEISLWFGKNI